MATTKKGNSPNTSLKSSGVGRDEIKGKFEQGRIPTEKDFALLIDSMVNQLDDGFKKDEDDGFIMVPPPGSKKILTFKKEINDKVSFFSIEKDDSKTPVSIDQATDNTNIAAGEDEGYLLINPVPGGNNEDTVSKGFYFHKNGNFGIGKTCNENHKMEVDGFLAAHSRIGSYTADDLPPDKVLQDRKWTLKNQVPADGKWYKIIGGLDNCNAFEIIARCGKVNKNRKTGRFALLHAIAVSSFGPSNSHIRKTSSCFGRSLLSYFDKINLKWVGNTHNYALWIKTNRHYGKDEDGNETNIFYRITKLWDDEKFTGKGYYY